MKNSLVKGLAILGALLALGGGAALATVASAQSVNQSTTGTSTTPSATKWKGGHGWMGRHMGHKSKGVSGTVTAVSGNTITITGRDGKSYTVDASTANIEKIESIPVSSIQVGDTIGAHGTLNGTNLTANQIMDGLKKFAPHAGTSTSGAQSTAQ